MVGAARGWAAGSPPGLLCRRAKLLLKKKRYREQLLDKTENQITSLETMVGRGRVWHRAGCGESPWALEHTFPSWTSQPEAQNGSGLEVEEDLWREPDGL